MKNIILASLLMLVCGQIAMGQTAKESASSVKTEIMQLRAAESSNQKALQTMRSDVKQLASKNASLQRQVDSLSGTIEVLSDSVKSQSVQMHSGFQQTNRAVTTTEAQLTSSIRSKSFVGIVTLVVLALLGIAVSLLLRKKVTKAGTAIDGVKNLQHELQLAQAKLEEESVKLDNKLVELLEQKISQAPAPPAASVPDHSLALKVADEVARMELNLSRMDPSIRGYKQLTKGIERIKNNFLAKGYEITDMLGKPYDEGMRIKAEFVIDESLQPGARIIRSITKPEVIYNGEIIQKAVVTIAQNI